MQIAKGMSPTASHNPIVTNFTDDFCSFPWDSTPLVKHFQMGLWESYQEVEQLFQTLDHCPCGQPLWIQS